MKDVSPRVLVSLVPNPDNPEQYITTGELQYQSNAKVYNYRGFPPAIHCNLIDPESRDFLKCLIPKAIIDTVDSGRLVTLQGFLTYNKNDGSNLFRVTHKFDEDFTIAHIPLPELIRRRNDRKVDIDGKFRRILQNKGKPCLLLVSGKNGTSYDKFIQRLGAYCDFYDLTDKRIHIQSEEQVISILTEKNYNNYDALVFLRGAGDGVRIFDSYYVLEATCECDIPIIAAIGDGSLRLDFFELVDKSFGSPLDFADYLLRLASDYAGETAPVLQSTNGVSSSVGESSANKAQPIEIDENEAQKLICPSCGFIDSGLYCSSCGASLFVTSENIYQLIPRVFARLGFVDPDADETFVSLFMGLAPKRELERIKSHAKTLLINDDGTIGDLRIEVLIVFDQNQNQQNVDELLSDMKRFYNKVFDKRYGFEYQGIKSINISAVFIYSANPPEGEVEKILSANQKGKSIGMDFAIISTETKKVRDSFGFPHSSELKNLLRQVADVPVVLKQETKVSGVMGLWVMLKNLVFYTIIEPLIIYCQTVNIMLKPKRAIYFVEHESYSIDNLTKFILASIVITELVRVLVSLIFKQSLNDYKKDALTTFFGDYLAKQIAGLPIISDLSFILHAIVTGFLIVLIQHILIRFVSKRGKLLQAFMLYLYGYFSSLPLESLAFIDPRLASTPIISSTVLLARLYKLTQWNTYICYLLSFVIAIFVFNIGAYVVNEIPVWYYSQQVSIKPTAEGYYRLGKAKYDRGRYEAAVEDYNKAIILKSNYAEAYNNRGLARFALGNYSDAIKDYEEAIKINSNYAEAYNNLGYARYTLGQKDRAIKEYEKAININPNYAEAYFNRGNAKDDLGDKKGAIEDYNQALKINPNDAYAYNNRGVAKDDLGDNQGAIEDYNQALKINPNLAEAYNNRGLAKSALGDNQGAIEDYNQALKINPNYAKAYFNRGVAKDDLGDKKGAIEDYNQALEISNQVININPKDATAYFNRGLARSALGNYKGAIEDYNQALKINPKNANAYYNRGLAKSALGKKREAIDDFKQASQLYQKQGLKKYYENAQEQIRKLQKKN